jgi:uncharacterized membrane protein YkvA (DUF1232 family)
MATWKARAENLRAEGYAVYLACRDPRVPWAPKLVVALVAAYAMSPIDLIPDFIPVIGYLDDLFLVPLGLMMAIRLIPPDVLEEHRAQAARLMSQPRPRSWGGVVLVITIWAASLALVVFVATALSGA